MYRLLSNNHHHQREKILNQVSGSTRAHGVCTSLSPIYSFLSQSKMLYMYVHSTMHSTTYTHIHTPTNPTHSFSKYISVQTLKVQQLTNTNPHYMCPTKLCAHTAFGWMDGTLENSYSTVYCVSLQLLPPPPTTLLPC
jgi:hypothetical protein